MKTSKSGTSYNIETYKKTSQQNQRDEGVKPTPPKENACSQKSGNVANVRSSRQGAKKLQFLSGCNF